MKEFMESIEDVFKFEIARELIIESGGSGSDEQTSHLLAAAKGNPYDCGILYAMLTYGGRELPA